MCICLVYVIFIFGGPLTSELWSIKKTNLGIHAYRNCQPKDCIFSVLILLARGVSQQLSWLVYQWSTQSARKFVMLESVADVNSNVNKQLLKTWFVSAAVPSKPTVSVWCSTGSGELVQASRQEAGRLVCRHSHSASDWYCAPDASLPDHSCRLQTW